MDDTFLILRINLANCTFKKLNGFNPFVQFTLEVKRKYLPFLDINTIKSNNTKSSQNGDFASQILILKFKDVLIITIISHL